MPRNNNGSWSEMQESILTKTEKKELSDLDEEIRSKEKLFIGPDGMLVKIVV